MTANRVLGFLGTTFMIAGCVVLAFVGFQLVGTNVIQQGHQDSLRSQLMTSLPKQPARFVPGGLPRPAIPTPEPPAGTPIAEIRIPAIGLDQVVVQGTDTAELEHGPGHYKGTPLPGEAGNVAIAGHRTTWGRPFYNLDSLKAGDPITLVTPKGTFVYAVKRTFIVDPSDVAVIGPTSANLLTLTTCNPRYSASQRLVARAVLTQSSLTPLVELPAGVLHPSQSTVTIKRASPWPPILFCLLTVLAGFATSILARRFRYRWVVYVVGGLTTFLLLNASFATLTPFLPANL
jgi:sortase A